MLEILLAPENLVALATLIALEVVLGIDNIVFITILVSGLPEQQRDRARQIGLALALLMRLLLLFSLAWVMGLVAPWFVIAGIEFSGRDMILIGGGLFLLGKATHEIHNSLEIHETGATQAAKSFASVIAQIAVIDMVFSLDSVITAVGMVDHLSIMVIAIVVSIVVMLVSAQSIGDFVDANPTFKMLALSFLILIGSTLIAEGFDVHIPRAYIYFAMAFSVGVEFLNMLARRRQQRNNLALQKKIPSVPLVEGYASPSAEKNPG
jgi:predicted tellurium resistance membrane protein TerC